MCINKVLLHTAILSRSYIVCSGCPTAVAESSTYHRDEMNHKAWNIYPPLILGEKAEVKMHPRISLKHWGGDYKTVTISNFL